MIHEPHRNIYLPQRLFQKYALKIGMYVQVLGRSFLNSSGDFAKMSDPCVDKPEHNMDRVKLVTVEKSTFLMLPKLSSLLCAKMFKLHLV